MQKAKRSAVTMIRGSSAVGLVFIVAALIGAGLLAVAVRVSSAGSTKAMGPATALVSAEVPRVPSVVPIGRLHGKLSFQPEADKLRRRLGQRFLAAGREQLTITGTLTLGIEQHLVAIVRIQDDSGESVSIGFDGVPALLNWTPSGGARSQGLPATGATRALIERIALDSPDQFVLSQLRPTSYRTIARNVVPRGAADLEDYSGPAWDVVLVNEMGPSGSRPLSDTRLYYINTKTGLLDKVVSREGGEPIVAELSSWTISVGENAPMRVTWKRGDQIVMDLNISGVITAPR
jgi:hypothetical protein